MAKLVRYEPEDLKKQRAVIEQRHTEKELRDIEAMRELTGTEYEDRTELERIAFLLGERGTLSKEAENE